MVTLVAGVPPKVTVGVPAKLVPLMVTTRPPPVEPKFGVRAVTVGGPAGEVNALRQTLTSTHSGPKSVISPHQMPSSPE